MPPTPDAYANSAARFLRVARGDRCAHEVHALIEGREETLLESRESHDGSSADWPASPPLQDWHFEERPEGGLFLAVGAAGKSHWSVSIELPSTPIAPPSTPSPLAGEGRGEGDTTIGANSTHIGPACIAFDVACRIKEPPAFLGSTYRVPQDCRQLNPATIELRPGVLLECEPATRLTLDKEAGIIVLTPIPSALKTGTHTVRWRYWIR